MAEDPILDFFALIDSLDAISRIKLETAYTTLRLNPHQLVYAEGDPADSVYIVASGVVEAFTRSLDGRSRSVAFMTRGSFFGDLGVLTGHPRLAGVRACEAAKVFRFEKDRFLSLLENIPQFGLYLSRLLAMRLHKTSSEAHHNIFALDLSGNLRRFDLLTIFQAITGMHHSGELNLNDLDNELIGSFFFREGRVEQARFVHLAGIEAVWQGFIQSATEGSFIFRVREEPSLPSTDEHRIGLESTSLLIEGVSRRDDYSALPEDLRAMGGRISAKVETVSGSDPETAELAGRIGELIAKRPQPLSSLWRRVNYSALTFLKTVQGLIETGQIEWLPEEAVFLTKTAPLPPPPA
jgi:CRP-like cAMP-binding protein